MDAAGRVYSGLSPAERDDERRRRLRGAGLDLIGTRGYAGTSVERLCAAARVSTKHFYLLYPNKEAAFLDLYGSITERSLHAAAASLAATAAEPMRVRVPAALQAYVGPMIADLRVARIAFVEVIAASPRIEEVRLAFRESLVALVVEEGRAAVDRGEIRDRDFRFVALALAGSANAIVYDWALRSDRVPAATLQAALDALALELLTDPI